MTVLYDESGDSSSAARLCSCQQNVFNLQEIVNKLSFSLCMLWSSSEKTGRLEQAVSVIKSRAW